MADITLAAFNGNVWLVGGETYVDDLLANTLPADISIELVACQRKVDIIDMWVRLSGAREFAGDPWIIHPAIVQRIRGAAAPDFAVSFAPWSVMPGEDGLRAIAAAAAHARDNPELVVVLAEYVDPAGPQAAADLSGLRLLMIEEALQKSALPRERIARVRRDTSDIPALALGGGRVDIVVRMD